MTVFKSTRLLPQPWSVPVAKDSIAATGQHFDLIADEATRAGVASMAGQADVPRLEAHFDVTRHGSSGLRVVGAVTATVVQTCIVTLEPLLNDTEEQVDLVFMPPVDAAVQLKTEVKDGPEPLVDGRIDLGAIATEFLMLGLDPYPRKPGVEFQPPQINDDEPGPFAALASLKSGRDPKRG
jgi:uncharacterized metal-binding protein YceD (DUF177 family)